MMKIFRWLLCHLLSIIIIVSVILIYIFRVELKEDFYRLSGNSTVSSDTIHASDNSQLTEQPVQQPESNSTGQVEQSTRQQDNGKPAKGAASSIAWGDRVIPGRQAGEQGAVADAPPATAAKDPWSEVLPATVGNSAPAASTASQQPRAAVDSASNFPPENYDPESAGQSMTGNGRSEIGNSRLADAAPPKASGQAGSGAEETADTPQANEYYRALEDVRQLYWNGKTGAARAAYEKLMFDYPEQPEAAAELGNIFLRQGDRKGASWAYQNAIPRYLNLHREEEAINLMRFISQYDPAIADSLQKKYW
jgi:hypothetical protein